MDVLISFNKNALMIEKYQYFILVCRKVFKFDPLCKKISFSLFQLCQNKPLTSHL